METHVLVKRIFTNGLNMSLLLQASVEKTVYKVETHWLSDKEKVPDAVVSKEAHVDSVLGHHYWYPWKEVTVNCSSYNQQLKQNSPYLLNDHLIIIINT